MSDGEIERVLTRVKRARSILSETEYPADLAGIQDLTGDALEPLEEAERKLERGTDD